MLSERLKRYFHVTDMTRQHSCPELGALPKQTFPTHAHCRDGSMCKRRNVIGRAPCQGSVANGVFWKRWRCCQCTQVLMLVPQLAFGTVRPPRHLYNRK